MELTREEIKEKFGYDYVGLFKQYDTAYAKLNDKYFHINRQGERLYTAEFDRVGLFNQHDTTWVKLNGKEFHINRQGERIYEAEFDQVSSFEEHNTTYARLNNKEFHINRQGNRLYTAEFDLVTPFDSYDTTYVVLNDKMFHINRQGERLYKEEFDSVSSFDSFDTTRAKLNDKMFHINRQGERLYTAEFDRVGSFDSYDTTYVVLNDKMFHINRQGERLYTFEFDEVGSFEQYDTSWAKLNDKYFHINRQGERLYTFEFDEVGPFEKYDTTWAVLNDMMFHINRQGERIEPIKIENIGSRNATLVIYKTDKDVYFKTGCFYGSLEKFKEAVIKTHHGNSIYYKDYMAVINKYYNKPSIEEIHALISGKEVSLYVDKYYIESLVVFASDNNVKLPSTLNDFVELFSNETSSPVVNVYEDVIDIKGITTSELVKLFENVPDLIDGSEIKCILGSGFVLKQDTQDSKRIAYDWLTTTLKAFPPNLIYQYTAQLQKYPHEDPYEVFKQWSGDECYEATVPFSHFYDGLLLSVKIKFSENILAQLNDIDYIKISSAKQNNTVNNDIELYL